MRFRNKFYKGFRQARRLRARSKAFQQLVSYKQISRSRQAGYTLVPGQCTGRGGNQIILELDTYQLPVVLLYVAVEVSASGSTSTHPSDHAHNKIPE